MTCTGSAHIAPNSAARCDIDLSPGARSVPAQRAGRREAGASCRARPRARARDRVARLLGDDAAADPQRDRAVRAGRRDTGPCPRCRSSHGRARARSPRRSPGRFGTSTRSSCTSPPARSDSSSRRRSSRAASFHSAIPSSSPAASMSRAARQARDHVVDRGDQRVGVGAVDAAPDRGVRARDAGDVAERRAGRGQPLALRRQHPRGLGDEHVREHVREMRDGGHHRRGCRARSPTATRRCA